MLTLDANPDIAAVSSHLHVRRLAPWCRPRPGRGYAVERPGDGRQPSVDLDR